MSNLSISSGSSQHTTLDWDTGFPDSFVNNTTSRRHPEAKTGEFAIIQANDVDPQFAINHRKHLLFAKHRRTISHGKVTQLETIFSSEAETESPHHDTGVSQPQLDGQLGSAAAAELERPMSSASSVSDKGKRKGIFRWRGN
ncbi:uncharacterized protein B0I36DRAFT_365408 [Microdochium trichocladiopsis]|uniref:Uncharacterized protein n=1 Tax=Microdochium trichocladiopsis TaxID=1682393 RepID=A0A9P9BQC7_9PEZI|nr:uncharacterized protein B0I36DRAFT_365408 [Microdochium trichocladiopsis]KAH7025737.1 hypothetical protein B0I36DRAFT_365408 [Microdochium trichocladiopsis]